MITLPGYNIKETIHVEGKTIFYRGVNIQNEQPFVIKILQTE